MKIINDLINKIIINLYKDEYKNDLKINGILYRRGRGRCIFGNNVTINSSKKSNYLGGKDYTTIFVSKDKNLTIGDNVGISNSTIVCHDKITIEDNVFIGADVSIYDTDFHPLNYNERISNGNNINTAPIILKSGCFIGAHSIILKGVIIGEKSIIGAGSVVAKNVPDNEIWAGNPAKFIKKIKGNGNNEKN